MAVYQRSLSFEADNQFIWAPGSAVNLRIAEFYGEAYIDFTIGLLAYARDPYTNARRGRRLPCP